MVAGNLRASFCRGDSRKKTGTENSGKIEITPNQCIPVKTRGAAAMIKSSEFDGGRKNLRAISCSVEVEREASNYNLNFGPRDLVDTCARRWGANRGMPTP